jgi:hypothetical protein
MPQNGVQIPQLREIEVQAPDSVGRTNPDVVPDLSRGIERQSRAAIGLGEELVNYSQRIEEQEADTEATNRSNQFEAKYRSLLYGDGETPGIKFQDGNPTDLYKRFDEQMIEEYNRLTNDDNLTGRTKELVMKRLVDKANQLELQKLTEYGYQQTKYEDQITSTAIDLEKNTLTDSSAFIKPGDEGSFRPFDEAIGRIRATRMRSGMKMGGVVPDENGNSIYINDQGEPMRVSISQPTNLALRKDLSEGIYDAMDNALKSGNTEVARAMKERYGQYLDPVRKKALADDFEKADLKDKAYAAAADAKRVGVDKALAGLDPEVRDKALGIIDDDQRRMENIRDRYSKNNYNMLMNHVNKRMRSDAPYSGMSELENDPVFANTIDKIKDAKQKQAIFDSVVIPKQSSDSANQRVNDLLYGRVPGEDVAQMSEEDWELAKSGLNRLDRNRADARRNSMMGETNAQMTSRYKQAGKELADQMIAVGYVKPDDSGKYGGKNQIKKIEAENEFMDYLDSLGTGPMSPKDIKDHARSFALSKKTGEAIKPPAGNQRFAGSRTGGGGQEPGTAKKLIKGKSRLEWAREYKKQYNREPRTGTNELNNFINSQD